MGQDHPVQVINLVTRGTIEERVLRTIEAKLNLFANIFNGDDDEIEFSGVNQTAFVDAMRELLTEPEASATVVAEPNLGGNAAFWAVSLKMLQEMRTLIESGAECPSEVHAGVERADRTIVKPHAH